jgi:hypothetical protein
MNKDLLLQYMEKIKLLNIVHTGDEFSFWETLEKSRRRRYRFLKLLTSSSSSEVNVDGPLANGNLEAAADVAELNVATPSASTPWKHYILENKWA